MSRIALYGAKRESSEKETTSEYNPRLKVLTFGIKDNVTDISVFKSSENAPSNM